MLAVVSKPTAVRIFTLARLSVDVFSKLIFSDVAVSSSKVTIERQLPHPRLVPSKAHVSEFPIVIGAALADGAAKSANPTSANTAEGKAVGSESATRRLTVCMRIVPTARRSPKSLWANELAGRSHAKSPT